MPFCPFDWFDNDSEHELDVDSNKANEYGGNGQNEDDWHDYVYEQDERRSYDPEIATEERIARVTRVRVLGVNASVERDTK